MARSTRGLSGSMASWGVVRFLRQVDPDDELVDLLLVRIEGVNRGTAPLGRWLDPTGPRLLVQTAKGLGKLQHAVVPDGAWLARSHKRLLVVGHKLGYAVPLTLTWTVSFEGDRLLLSASDPLITHIAVRVFPTDTEVAAGFAATAREAVAAAVDDLSTEGQREVGRWRTLLEQRGLIELNPRESFVPPTSVSVGQDGLDDVAWWLVASATGAAWLGDSQGVVEDIVRRTDKTSPRYVDFLLYALGLSRLVAKTVELSTSGSAADLGRLERWSRLIKGGSESFEQTVADLSAPGGVAPALKMIAVAGSIIADPGSDLVELRRQVATWVAANQALRAELERAVST